MRQPLENTQIDRARIVIEFPALAAGRIVICDRYDDSTLAYQGAGRGLDAALLASWNAAATGGLAPDLTLLFDLDPQVGLGRRATAGLSPNRIDRESLEFHRRVREGYLALAARDPERWVVLDAGLPHDVLQARIWDAVESRRRAARASATRP